MHLQTILKPDKQICEVEELYFHRDGKLLQADGFFNLFYIEKRKKYTALERLFLCMELKGFSKIHLMHDREEIASETLSPAEKCAYRLELPYQETERGVFWFSLEKEPEVKLAAGTNAETEWEQIDGWYEGEASAYNEINIAADICTYRREDYVLRNLQSICSHIFSNEALEVRDHLRVWLIDNGQTLSSHEGIQKLLAGENRITVCPNKNAGGAGGFTRGMIEVLQKKEELKLTHVLLMDDDAVFAPDLFVRLYGLLTTLKQEYRDITVGGNLMREDYPYLQQACGERFENFSVQNSYELKDMREYENCVSDYMTAPVMPEGTYSGWWCCCYSLNTVRKDNLPLPLFIHHDDIEFGMRNQDKGIVFLNGIGAWHRGFELTFSGVNRYYDVRNALMTMAFFYPEKSTLAVLKYVWKAMTSALISYRYAETELAYQGFRDFCRGPKWLIRQNPEQLNNALRAQIKLEPYEALKEKLTEQEYHMAVRRMEQYADAFGVEQILHNHDPEKRRGGKKKKLTFNGWSLPAKRRKNGEIRTISALDSPFEAYREKQIILFEPFSRKAVLAKKDYQELLKAAGLYWKALMLIVFRYPKAARAYRKHRNQITGYGTWIKYLGIK
ncbi:MAG: glycosyltransferase [Eubacteriales bacterium]|nr:glycosyltransferase [Eubacteriales bacterium]